MLEHFEANENIMKHVPWNIKFYVCSNCVFLETPLELQSIYV